MRVGTTLWAALAGCSALLTAAAQPSPRPWTLSAGQNWTPESNVLNGPRGSEQSDTVSTTTLSGGLNFNQRRTTLVFNYDFFHRAEIRNARRDFARNADFRLGAPAPWNGTTADNTVDLRSDRGFFGRFQRGTVSATNTVSGSRPAGVTTAQVAPTARFISCLRGRPDQAT